MNSVLTQMLKTSYTANGAISNSSTGSSLLDYFSKVGTYTKRSQEDVNTDMVKIFAEDPKNAIKLVFGTRLISRRGSTGFGRRDEFYKACKWLNENKPELLYKNLHLIPQFGSWKDFFNEPFLDLLNQVKVFELVSKNIFDDLLKKYLPQIRSKTRSTRDKKRSDWAKNFCKWLGCSEKIYRLSKKAGKAHLWQQLMSAKQWTDIDFNQIPGKAIFNHISQKGRDKKSVFERHGLVESLKQWLETQPIVKCNMYPYELVKAASKPTSEIQRFIYNKQFKSILQNFSGHSLGNVLSCLDISGSMGCQVIPNVSAMDIGLSMGLVFSALNIGHFKDTVCGFSDSCMTLKLAGEFTDRLHTLQNDSEFQRIAWGSTNFQGVIDLLVKIRTNNPEIPVEEYPDTLLVVSDMQFNPSGRNTDTNYEQARKKLAAAGLKDVLIIWWYVNGQSSDFPSTMQDKGVLQIGGFSPENLKTLMGKEMTIKEKSEITPMEGMNKWLSQSILENVSW